MPRAEARIATAQPSRYLARLCQHATKVDHKLRVRHGRAGQQAPEVQGVEWNDHDAVLTLDRGTCTLHADGAILTVAVEAISESDLAAVQEIIVADLERFGRRDGLTVTWERETSNR